jgi:LysR family nod box-dependent transcriptional activator
VAGSRSRSRTSRSTAWACRGAIEFSVERFLLAPFLLQGTELVALVPARAEGFLRRTGSIRLLDPPVELPIFVETLWWHPRATTDPAHAWLRARIEDVAASLAV